jgi:hypothetical protein
VKRFLAAAVASLVLAAPAAAGAQEEPAEGRVLVVSYPRLDWERVVDERPPALLGLLERSAIASMSIRTIGPTTEPGEAYATIGAGNRAGTERESAGLAMPPDAIFEGGEARGAYLRRTGIEPTGQVLHIGAPRMQRRNNRLLYETEVGALGSALEEGDRTAAVIANADEGPAADAGLLHREASLAVMTSDGQVAGGVVGPELVVEDPVAPFGLRVDPAAAGAAFDEAWAEHDVVLLEMSDLERADTFAPNATPDAAEAAARGALEVADRLLAHALESVDLERDLVLVLGPTTPGGKSGLTVAAIAGAGIEPGQARSATTRRAGYVTLPDVAPTILGFFDLDVPDVMTGTEITSRGGDAPTIDDFEDLADVNDVTRFRDRAIGPVSVAFIVFQVLGYGLAVFALARHVDRLRPVVGFVALMTLAIPPVVFLSGLLPYHRLGLAGYGVAVFVAAAGLAALALAVGGRGTLVPPLLLVGLMLAVLLADIASGGRLQINTVFGYSPIVAGRFAGYGNQAFALLAMTSIVFVTGLWTLQRPQERRSWGPLAVAAGLCAVALVADGHPALGSDVGGVLALVPAYAVVLLLLGGVRMRWRTVLIIGVVTLGALAVFAAVDLARPEESRTHLGRLVSRLGGDDGSGGFATVLQRKAQTNVSILVSSVWTLIIPAAIAFLAFLTWRQPRLLRHLQSTVPGLRAALVGGLVAGLLGFALNDSGVAVPAMMLAVALPYVSWLAVRP